MSIRTIILEEIKALIEGTGDVYAANKWGITDPGKEFEDQWQRQQKTDQRDDINGELVGSIQYTRGSGPNARNTKCNIYKNPKDLKNFEPEVRAVSDYDGNLYVAQLDGPFYHSGIAQGIEGENSVYDAYDRDYNITWHRIGSTNKLCYSISFKAFADSHRDFLDNDLIEPALRVRFEKLRKVNPTLTFEEKYCGDLGQDNA